MMFSLSETEEKVAKLIVNPAYIVHKKLGPGLLESVYEVCFCYELEKAGLNAQRQIPAPVVYENIVFDLAFRLDVLVENMVICELKAIDVMHPVFEAQLLSHLKLTGKRLGFLIQGHLPIEWVKKLTGQQIIAER